MKKGVFRGIWTNSWKSTRLIWPGNRRLILAYVFILVVLSAVPFLISGSRGLLVNQLISSFGQGQVGTSLALVTFFLIVASFLAPVFNSWLGYVQHTLWLNMEARFDLLVTRKKSEIDVATHENPKFNDLIHRVRENGTGRLRNFIERQLFLTQNIAEVLIASVILTSAGWWIFALVLVGTIPSLIIEARYGNRVWHISQSQSETKRRYYEVHRHFDSIVSITELKLFQNIGRFLGIISTLFDSFRREEKAVEKKKLIYLLIGSVISQVTTTVAIIWYISQVTNGLVLVGTFTFLLSSLAQLNQSLSGLFGNLGRQYHDNLFVTDIFQLLETKPLLPQTLSPVSLPTKLTPEIIFENVTFLYPGAVKPTLDNLSFTIPAGEKLAIVGHNGAGKTTLIKLLCRFYDPTSGRIMIGGHDLRELDLESWYNHLGLLFQSYARYQFPVKEAIALGRDAGPLDESKVKQAAQQSGSNDFIERYPLQYEQMLGKQFTGGVEPSGGEWQKLALARVFYRDPQIYVLDEPTAAIDAEAETKIFEQMERLPNDRTVILISHRFSTVRRADKIMFINHGQLTEAGTHDELINLNGEYARLFRLQAKGYQS